MGAGFIALTFLVPNMAFAGLLAILSAYLFAYFIGMKPDFLKTGFYTYNPLLVGLAIGYLFKLTPLTIFFVVFTGIFTFVVTIMLDSLFWQYLRLPILSVPFVGITSIVYLAASNYTNLFVTALYPHPVLPVVEAQLPFWVTGFLKSLGAVFFLPNVWAGLGIAVILLVASRILFMLAVVGYYSGSLLIALLVGSPAQAFADINHFNFILIAMAVGGVFLIPSLKSYVLALIAVCSATVLLDAAKTFWSDYGIPGFTLPFNVVSLSFVYVLGLIAHPLVVKYIKQTPEETLDYYLLNLRRFRGSERTLSLPFSGTWQVWQGFDGSWTHQGSWRYAYDFIIVDDKGNSYQHEGTVLTDYYCFRKPVLSPVRGRVVRVISHLPDNPIGEVDKSENWGNLIIIEDPRGFYVEISHFAHDSIRVNKGDWVERGTLLGLCGNSGYSPQPHLHVQVQATSEIGSYTLPFSFVSYTIDHQFYANDVPPEGAQIEPIYPDKHLDAVTAFMLDDRYEYRVLKNGQPVGYVRLTVRMAPDGTFYLDSGKGQLYFGKHEGTFYMYRLEGNCHYLKMIFLALPRLPLSAKVGLSWQDHIPVGVVARGITKMGIRFLSSFYHGLAHIQTTLTVTPAGIEGKIESKLLNLTQHTYLELDDYAGIKSVRIGSLELRRNEDETIRG